MSDRELRGGVVAGIRIGTAGWSIPQQRAHEVPGEGSYLERYSRLFRCAEINSSFYRSHRLTTYHRWAAVVPATFRFAVKLPREISHHRKLVEADEPLDRFLAEIGGLGDRLGPVLVQLPPRFHYNEAVAAAFFSALRARFDGGVVVEPRNPSWFHDDPDALLSHFRIGRVAADPAPVPRACQPGGWRDIHYYRLHGSPRVYYSAYAPEQLDLAARQLRAAAASAQESWCIFDNTAGGSALGDAKSLMDRLSSA